MNKKRLLIILIRNPELGKCKTRLAATIGDEKALIFYRNMLKRTKEVVEKVVADKVVSYSSYIDLDDLWPNNPPFYKQVQNQQPDLGLKMQSAFEVSFAAGYKSVCIIGSDCYNLNENIIEEAFKVLENKDVVLGPSTDGGYYLLGMNTMHQEFFHHKRWSTDSVASDTIQDFKNLNLDYSLLKDLTDIDVEEDLHSLPADVVSHLLKPL